MSTAVTPGWRAQMLLVEPDAGGAGDAFEDQRGLALVLAALRPHEVLLHLGMVEQAEFLQGLRQRLARALRQRVAVAVVVGQAVGDDGLRHRLAAGAAHRARARRRCVDRESRPPPARAGRSDNRPSPDRRICPTSAAMRIAPSRRITSPLSISFSMMCRDQRGVLGRLAQARRERHHLAQRVLHFLRHAEQHRRLEDARGDGHDADAEARQFARDRQRHADDAALGGGIGGLADLAVEGRHRGGVDDHAALAGGIRLRPCSWPRPPGGSC